MSKSTTLEKSSIIKKAIFLCLCILLFYPPYYRGLFFDKELLPTQIFSFLLLVLWIGMKIKIKDFKFITNYVDMFALGVVFMYFISCFYGVNTRLSIREFLKYSNYFFVYLLAKDFSKDLRLKKIISNILLFSAFGVAIVGIGSAIGTWNYKGAYVWERINSTLQYPNALAAYMGAIFFFAIGYFLNERRFLWRTIYAVAASIFFFTLILTFSRGMWLLMPVLFVLYILILPKEDKIYGFVSSILYSCIGTIFAAIFQKGLRHFSQGKLWGIFFAIIVVVTICIYLLDRAKKLILKINYKYLYILLGSIIILGLLTSLIVIKDIRSLNNETNNKQMSIVSQKVIEILPDSIAWRFKDIINGEQNAFSRIYFYRDALKIIKEYLVFGTGGGGWKTLYFKYQSYFYESTQAHNYFLQLWIEIGTIGVLLMISFILSIIRSFYKSQKYEENDNNKTINASIFLSIITLIAHSTMDFDLSLSALSIVLWVLIGLVSSNSDNKKLIESSNKKVLSYCFLGVSVLLVLISSSLYLGYKSTQEAIKEVKSKNIDEAIVNFEKASKYDPFNANVKADLSQLYLGKAKNDKDYILDAKVNIDKAVELAPYDTKILSLAANYYLGIREIDKAKEFADKLVEVCPMKTESYQSKSQFYIIAIKYLLEKKDYSRAKEYIQNLVKIEDEFELADKNSVKPMEMTEKTKEYIQNGKGLLKALDTKK